MEENKDNVKTPDAVVDKSGKEFKAVKQSEKKQKGQSNFGKSVAVPFLSGVLGATLVLGTCLGVPEIRSNIIRENNNNNNSVNQHKCVNRNIKHNTNFFSRVFWNRNCCCKKSITFNSRYWSKLHG